jgi:DNA-binding response OmpR family regulator
MENKRKILIVDDNIKIVQLLETYVKKLGYEVIIGKNGKEAVELYLKHAPDLIIMDVIMPELDGLKACETIKESHKKKGFIPVILLTGQNSLIDRMKGHDSGADDYLTKPFNIGQLSARIRSMLRIKELTEQLKNTQIDLIDARQAAAVAATAVTVNHEINSPLTRILVNAENLKEKLSGDFNSKYHRHLDDIMDAANKIGALTKKLTRLPKASFVDYLPGTSMLDLNLPES